MALSAGDLLSALDAEAAKIRLTQSAERRLARGAPPLTAEQATEFTREGFLVIDTPQISQRDIEWSRHVLMSLISRGAGRKDGRSCDLSARDGDVEGTTPQLYRPSLYAPELAKWSYRKVGLAIAKQLLGPDAALSGDNCILKPCRIGGPTPWHQDEAHNDPNAYQEQVTIWIALFDTTPANGAMAFVPRSHLRGVLPHRAYGGADGANSIECCGDFDPKDAKVCPIPAGGITIHHGLTIHGAFANKSDSLRLGYIFNYKNLPKPRLELGTFPWNGEVGKSIRDRRRLWLRRGGIFIDVWRYSRSDRDNLRHFIRQILRRLKR
jgi:hypothetical protein